jgi:hypothetical protein
MSGQTLTESHTWPCPLPAVVQVVGFIGGEVHQCADHLKVSDKRIEFGHLFRIAVIVSNPDSAFTTCSFLITGNERIGMTDSGTMD